jgi:hypothetical protein
LAGPIHDRQIKQLPAKSYGTLAAGVSLIKSLQDSPRVVDLFGRGSERGIHRIDL